MVTTAFHAEKKCTWNLIVRPELEFEKVNVQDFDALAIAGGFEKAGFYEDAYDERLLNLIRAFDREEKTIASVCVSALPIGKSGVLKNRKATTYDLMDGFRRKQLADFGAVVLHESVVVDKNIITSTGPSTGLEVAFKLVEMLSSQENVAEIKKYMRFTD